MPASPVLPTFTQRPSAYTIDRICGFISALQAEIVINAASFKKGTSIFNHAPMAVTELHDFMSKSHTPVSVEVCVMGTDEQTGEERRMYFGFVATGRTLAWFSPPQLFSYKTGIPASKFDATSQIETGIHFWDAAPVIADEDDKFFSVWHDPNIHAPYIPHKLKKRY